MKKPKFLMSTVFISFLLATYPAAFAAPSSPLQGKRAVVLSPASDLSALPATKQSLHSNFQGTAPGVKTIEFKLDLARCFVYPAPEGYEYLNVNDLKPVGVPGTPQLPMKTFVVELDKSVYVYGVDIISGKFSEVEGEVNVVPMPQPGEWRSDKSTGLKYAPDKAVYGLNTLFPGKLISYDTGADNEHQYVFVRVFPLQYTPNKKKAVLVTEARINVYYGDTPLAPDTETGGSAPLIAEASTAKSAPVISSQCIIICPASLQNEANALVNFHSSEGIDSSVVTTEDINANYVAAPDPPFNGYTNSRLKGWRSIRNYNYTLAKKIIAYLRDNAAHPNLAYVTIFGDGLLVPPSYYWYYDTGAVSSYSYWYPTDLFYASPDYDFVPNFKVGRLSVSSASEAATLVNKIVNWYGYANWSWFNKAYLAGGRPFDNTYYDGEMVTSHAINQEYFSGMDITKCFHTDGTYTKTCIEPALSTAEAGILYNIGYGLGNAFTRLDGVDLTAADLMGYSLNVKVPVVVSVACDNAAFDLDLMAPIGYNISFGEAVLKSQAGGIAYVGSVRASEGVCTFYYDQGNVVITDVTYLAGVLTDLFQSYRQGKDTLGDLFADGLALFVQNHEMTGDVLNQQSAFTYVLLGDAALKIPAIVPATEYPKAICVAQNPNGYDTSDIPFYNSVPITISATTTSPTIKWKLIDANADVTIDNGVINYPPFAYTSNQSAASLYLSRAATEAAVTSADYAKENWLFYSIGQSAQTIHVSSIGMSVQTQGPNKYAIANVTIVNSSNSPVPGATVSGHWSGLTIDSDSGVTGSNGQVSLSSDKVSKNASGTFTFCVDNVSLSGGVYDPNANIETCDSITTGPMIK